MARYLAVGFSIGTKGYIGNGNNGSGIPDFWEWDQATNVWTQKQNFGTRDQAIGFSIGAKGYIGTGAPNTKDFREYFDTCFVATSITENIDKEFFVNVFPNPSNGVFTLSSEITKGEVSVYNVKGEKVFTSTINHQPSTFDISSQPDGIYFVRVNTERGVIAKKVVLLSAR